MSTTMSTTSLNRTFYGIDAIQPVRTKPFCLNRTFYGIENPWAGVQICRRGVLIVPFMELKQFPFFPVGIQAQS